FSRDWSSDVCSSDLWNNKPDGKERSSMIDGIYVSYGHKPVEMVQELLQHLNLARSIAPGARIGLKPNLVVARPAWEGATTSPQQIGRASCREREKTL